MEKLKKCVSSLKFLFSAVLVLTVIVILLMLFPDTISLGPNVLIIWVLLALSGIGLIIATYKKGIKGKIKLFLLCAGFSSAGFFVGVVLHNMFYALGILTEDLVILNALMNALEVGFFIAAVVICPIGLLAGIIGTLVLWKKLPD